MTSNEMNHLLSILRWLNDGDPLRGWGSYEMFGEYYITYDHPYPQGREYWRLNESTTAD